MLPAPPAPWLILDTLPPPPVSVLQSFGNFLFQVAYGDSHFLRQSWPLLLVSAENLDGLRMFEEIVLCVYVCACVCVCVFVFVCLKLFQTTRCNMMQSNCDDQTNHIDAMDPWVPYFDIVRRGSPPPFWQCVSAWRCRFEWGVQYPQNIHL